VTFPRDIAELRAPWLASALGRSALESIEVERIGVELGLDARIARIRLHPGETVVAKWTKAAYGAREARFLGEVGPSIGIGLPRLHASFADEAADVALLLMDDVAPARPGNVFEGVSARQAEALVDRVAALHAAFWDRANDPRVSWLPIFGTDGARRAARTAEALPRFLAELSDLVPAAARAEAERLPERLADVHDALGESPRTVVHGDLHAENLLFLEGDVPVILDWTDVSLGPAVVDYAHMLVEVLTPQSRRQTEPSLSARYIDALERRGVRDYGIDRLRADVDRVLLVLFADAIRWATRSISEVRHPRERELAQNLVRNIALAVADGSAP